MFPDFLTATTTNDAVGWAFRNLVFDRSESPRYRILMGAEGYQSGGIFVGRFPGGRWLITASGSEAEVPWIFLDSIDDADDISVARVDLQMTLHTRDADYVINQITPASRYKATRIVPINSRGTTLYIGSPASDKRLRIYNKSAQLGEDAAVAELLRVELQLRNAHADTALAAARTNSKEGFFSWWRATCCAMAPALEGILPRASIAHIHIAPRSETEKSYKAWVEGVVAPALLKAQLTRDWEEIRLVLLKVLAVEGEKEP